MTIEQLLVDVARKRGVSEEQIAKGNLFVDVVYPGERKNIQRELTKAQEESMRLFIELTFIMQDDPEYRIEIGKRIERIIERN